MNTGRLLRLSIVTASISIPLSACQQGASVGPYPSGVVTATPTGIATATATPTGIATATAIPTIAPTSSPTPVPTATPTAVATATPTTVPTATPTSSAAAAGALVITPNPVNFGLLSVLGATQTASITQTNYSGPFTLPANPVSCAGGLIGDVPVTPTISGSTLSVSLGALGLTGVCTVTVDGGSGKSATETINLSIPVGTPPNAGTFTFSTDPIDFNVINAVAGKTGTTTVSETGYTGAFTLPASAISCPFNLLPLTQLTASISGNTVTVNTGALNANLLGSCTVTVDDANGNSGQFGVNFQLL